MVSRETIRGAKSPTFAKPPATIIVPLLEQRNDWLEQSIVSAVEQTVCCEVIVVHASRTSTSNRDLLRTLELKYPNLKVTDQGERAGFAAAINVGIGSSSSERIGLLMTDDWLDLNAVERCLDSPYDIVSTGLTTYRADGRTRLPEISTQPSLRGFEQLKSLPDRASYLSHFFLFRAEKVRAVGGVDEKVGDFAGVDDFDLIWVMLEHGATVGIVEESLYNYRDHEGDRLTTKDRASGIRDLEKILVKHKVAGAEWRRLIASHSRWYGDTIEHAYNRLRKMTTGADDIPGNPKS
jgi:GT2 family glycosyltransferase